LTKIKTLGTRLASPTPRQLYFQGLGYLKDLVMISLKVGGEMLDAKMEEQTDYNVQSYTNCEKLI
jgi:hypothetical protein